MCISVDKSAYYPATFMFNLNGHNWIYANGVTCSPSEINLEDIGKKKVIAQTIPANSDDKIIEVYDHLTGKTWDWYNSTQLIMMESHQKLRHQEDMHGSHLRQEMERPLQLT